MNRLNLKRAAGMLLAGLMLFMGAVLGSSSADSAMFEGNTASAGQQGQVIQVQNVDELLAAIGPNVTVELAAGEYDLAGAASYGKDTGNRFCRWEETLEQGYELHISDVDGLTIKGAGVDGTVLLAEDRYASVLCFINCRQLAVEAVTAGHNPAPGYCSGGVLHLTGCNDVTVKDCGLFGCGTEGVWAVNCSNILVKNSRIYECSDSAVLTSNCHNVQVLESEIDHNGWRSEYVATCLFMTNGGTGFTVSGCRIHDNVTDMLMQCSNTGNASFISNRVMYNVIRNTFSFYGKSVVVDNCNFHRNDIDSWYAEGYGESTLPAVNSNGMPLAAEDFSALAVPAQMSGSEEIVWQEPTEVPPGGEIVVTNIDDFLAAIGPDRTIILNGENFSLADAVTYGTDLTQYYRWVTCYDGPQLVITGVSNLTIRSAGSNPAATTFTAVPRYADVICFQDCSNIRIDGLTMGHTEGAGDCSGVVLDFENCNGITVNRCCLYGCGTLGVNAYTCSDLRLTDCEIYDCSIGGVVLYAVYGASFQNCRIHDVPSPMLDIYDSTVFWNGSVLYDNHYDITPSGEVMSVSIRAVK
jgi:hypothetical protein